MVFEDGNRGEDESAELEKEPPDSPRIKKILPAEEEKYRSERRAALRGIADASLKKSESLIKESRRSVGLTLFAFILLSCLAAASFSGWISYQSFLEAGLRLQKPIDLEKQISSMDQQLKILTGKQSDMADNISSLRLYMNSKLNTPVTTNKTQQKSTYYPGNTLEELMSKDQSASTNDVRLEASNRDIIERTDLLLWWTVVRAFVTAAITLGLLAYMLATMRERYTHETTSFRDTQNYNMDMNRASWIIQTALELDDSDGRQIPDIWLASVSHGLFRRSDNSTKEAGSLSALASLMALGPELNVGPSSFNLKIPPKAAKKAAKEEE